MEQLCKSFRLLATWTMLVYLLCHIKHTGSIKIAAASAKFSLTNETDLMGLMAIKGQIKADPFMFFSSWNHSVHFCSWQGVKCSLRHQRVTVLNLSSLALVGSLSPFIGNLTFLRALVLDNNSFYGAIPQEIGKLSRLQLFTLSTNSFQGEFPTNLTHCLEIKVINLDRNNLGGKIPDEFCYLSNLIELRLSANQFTGMIPPSLGNLSSLNTLSLSDNSLVGDLPSEFGKLANLEFLYLSSNKLSGVVPSMLFNISSMKSLVLTSNSLNGTFPHDLGFTLPRLETILVGGNQFSGPIPASICNATALVNLDISMNTFTGPIPMNLGNSRHLKKLELIGNLLGSNETNGLTFINSLVNCTNLSVLHLTGNGLGGLFPVSIANLSNKLTSLRLDENNISGHIPVEIGNLINLRYLAVDRNMLTGGIPYSIGKLINLQALYVSANKLSGSIPSSIGNITLLSSLSMRENMLQGSIPADISHCWNLQELDLSHNQLTGAVPEEVFNLTFLSLGLNLAQNSLTGRLQETVGNLGLVERFDLSNNNFSGELPSSIGACISLEFLDVHGNLFGGAIPSSLGSLRAIGILDLSCNNFSGEIPSSLGGQHFFGHFVNLSFNMLEGEVPNEGIFEDSTAFSVFGNKKLCGGIKPLELPACPVGSPVKHAKPSTFRVGIVAASIAFVLLMLFGYVLAIFYRGRRKLRNLKIQPSSATQFEYQYPKVAYRDLFQATDGFSPDKLIGKGRYSSVYKGTLGLHNETVAVKVINLKQRGARKSFIAECESMRGIRHRNLVKIITSCSGIDFKGNEFKALICDYMQNGSLESWLHPSSSTLLEPKRLSLFQRLNIAIDVASALHYLHCSSQTPIIHGDVKPSNILLDNDLCAHLGDFGSARSLLNFTERTEFTKNGTVRIVGTIGYVALEYGIGGPVSTLVDVYSYGIFLLEMFTGKRPTDSMFKDDFTLHNYVKLALSRQVMGIVDSQLKLQMEGDSGRIEKCLASLFQIGVACSANLPSQRMDITDVLINLNEIRSFFLHWDTDMI